MIIKDQGSTFTVVRLSAFVFCVAYLWIFLVTTLSIWLCLMSDIEMLVHLLWVTSQFGQVKMKTHLFHVESKFFRESKWCTGTFRYKSCIQYFFGICSSTYQTDSHEVYIYISLVKFCIRISQSFRSLVRIWRLMSMFV